MRFNPPPNWPPIPPGWTPPPGWQPDPSWPPPPPGWQLWVAQPPSGRKVGLIVGGLAAWIMKRRAELTEQIDAAEARWLEASEALEAA